MRPYLKIAVLMLLWFVCSLDAQAQGKPGGGGGGGGGGTTPGKPITLVKTADMGFGTIAVSGSGGSVILAPDGSRTQTGGVTLPVTSGFISAASFEAGTNGNSTAYSITFPASHTISNAAGNTMTLTNFTSFPNSPGTFTNGIGYFTVGATLHVGASQPPGNYTNGVGFDVTVNYY